MNNITKIEDCFDPAEIIKDILKILEDDIENNKKLLELYNE